MKKIIIGLIVLLSFSLVSCGNNRNGSIVIKSHFYNMPCADSEYYVRSLDEYKLWTYEKIDMHENHNAPETVTVSFNGSNYTGKYWYSSVEYYNIYESDFYEFDNGWFSVKSGTNDLDSITFYRADIGSKSEDDCYKIAKEVAEQYIETDEYELVTDADDEICYFVYTRMIEGLETCDRLSIGVSTSGEIVSLNMWMCPEMKERINAHNKESAFWVENHVKELTEEKFEESLFEKISASNSAISNLKVINVIVVALDNSNFGLVYNIEGEYITEDSENGGDLIEPMMMSFLAFNEEVN